MHGLIIPRPLIKGIVFARPRMNRIVLLSVLLGACFLAGPTIAQPTSVANLPTAGGGGGAGQPLTPSSPKPIIGGTAGNSKPEQILESFENLADRVRQQNNFNSNIESIRDQILIRIGFLDQITNQIQILGIFDRRKASLQRFDEEIKIVQNSLARIGQRNADTTKPPTSSEWAKVGSDFNDRFRPSRFHNVTVVRDAVLGRDSGQMQLFTNRTIPTSTQRARFSIKIENIPYPNRAADPVRAYVDEVNRHISRANDNLAEMTKGLLSKFEERVEIDDDFTSWIPQHPERFDPNLGASLAASERIENADEISAEQLTKGLENYHSFLRRERDILEKLFDQLSSSSLRMGSLRDEERERFNAVYQRGAILINEENSNVNREKIQIYRSVIDLTSIDGQLKTNLLLYMLVAFVVSIVVLHVLILKAPETISHLVFGSNALLNIFTVFVIVTSIVILSMSDKLGDRELGTLIGAISGYVLGQLGRSRSDNRIPSQEMPQMTGGNRPGNIPGGTTSLANEQR